MVLSTIFTNMSVKSWLSVLLMKEPEYPEKTTDLLQITDKLRLSGILTHNFSGDRH